MNTKYPYLSDSSFLAIFDTLQIKEQFVKITVLDLKERPIQDIQGQVTAGSLTVDGSSTVRRTCNITFMAKENQVQVTNVNNLLAINKKVRLEIGFTNTTSYYKDYPILWFPLGVYLIISLSLSHNNSGLQVNLQLKDKMCLLNGECGGVIPSAVDFSQVEEFTADGPVTQKVLISQIIVELVNHFGQEQLGKILISDLDDKVKQVVKWQGNQPLYYIEKTIKDRPDIVAASYTTNINEVIETNKNDNEIINFHEYNIGEDIGYQLVKFVYPNDLVVDAGATVTSVLDTIKDALGNFEYFYDLDGNFIFQEIKNYLNTSYSSILLKDIQEGKNIVNILGDSANPYIVDRTKGKTPYLFDNSKLITSYTNNPQYNMIKNDFIVWGTRKTLDGLEFPIRYHLAIDSKPICLPDDPLYSVYFKEDEEEGTLKIWEASLELNSGSTEWFGIERSQTTSTSKILKFLNSIETIKGRYEKIAVYSNNLHSSNQAIGIIWNPVSKRYEAIGGVRKYFIRANDWRTKLLLDGIKSTLEGGTPNYYYAELLNEWTKIYDILAIQDTDEVTHLKYYKGAFREDILNNLTSMDYFLDFIEPSSQAGALDIETIGRRTKVLNDKDVNCIFEPSIPDYILIGSNQEETENDRNECLQKGYKYIQVDDEILNGLSNGGHFNSAFNAIQDLLYQHTSYNETVTINCLPIYYLEPNTRIYIKDDNSDIYGDYCIKSFTVPLDINGTMSITANRVLDKI
jgi:hypothetical protein